MSDCASLYLLNIETTNSCNYSCKHCYGSFAPRHDSKTIDFKKIKELIPLLVELGLRRVHLSGGEPLLLGSKIFDIISFLKDANLEVFLLTNGSLLRESTLRELEKSKINGIQISGFGTEKHHNFIRNNNNAYVEFVAKLEMLSESEIYSILMITLFRQNILDIDHAFSLAEKYNVKNIAFERMIPVGSASTMDDNLTSEEYFCAINKISGLFTSNSSDINVSFSDPLYVMTDRGLQDYASNNKDAICGGCTAGSVASISPTGEIYPCAKLRIPLGNIYCDDFRQLWIKNKLLKRLRFRINYNHKCRGCRYLNACSGCRASALALTNDIFGEDPLCWIK